MSNKDKKICQKMKLDTWIKSMKIQVINGFFRNKNISN